GRKPLLRRRSGRTPFRHSPEGRRLRPPLPAEAHTPGPAAEGPGPIESWDIGKILRSWGFPSAFRELSCVMKELHRIRRHGDQSETAAKLLLVASGPGEDSAAGAVERQNRSG